ncbi:MULTISPECIES: electron transfer flavoprotein subunit beta/FixA family protein [Metallosphaera]|uniref:Electron transfer flavoprotein beta-subunit n=3 Tax=Metallosphaera TaxID=41980 RepID=A4YDK6_METS5|nr:MULTISPECIES: electron transfer flavoprotein subunit beta/FixA family protein [Metallosphaera]ABP94508.1 electron transfer flavoprotein beta-subunit [Metallosphaera sedula DSM 5348]AIM26495.1 electron transfer flavoprotein beta-subunit [Metallosphaera sedula]AKV73489.1 electron transfer flavoprotein subunit alpha [Metallosphaera sedula]AKV75731.1 electron transfer flavoprotein subunit alpha [Metallosphaera sedula]AKV77978.1 electron transfer flavoprotein subunit alpha [Metallosphaera sedula
MSVVACFKVVPDDTSVRVIGGKVETNVPVKISTYDKNAIEEAVRLKEKLGWKAIGVTVGNTDRKSIRDALSMGLDEVVAISTGYLDVAGTAMALAETVRGISPKLVLMAETTTDSSTSALPPYLAQLLGYPLISYVRSLTIHDSTITAERSVGDVEVVEAPLPAVVSVTGEINTPRTPSVKQIMESAKKPVKQVNFSSQPLAELVEVQPFVTTRKKVIIEKPMAEAVDQLINYLKGEGVL